MEIADWRRVEALVDVALEWPEPQRLTRLGAADEPPHIIQAARRLLASIQASEGFLDAPSSHVEPSTVHRLSPGERAGLWSIVRWIGRGGMGDVYEVERADGAFSQRAALKVAVQRDGGLAEGFGRERRILARLEHPGIARLIDGAVLTDGRPYMVMEYVEGQSVDEYVHVRQLGARERIALMLEVADALAFAHAHLVVHRDIKPSNILVDATGRARLIDFGVAGFAGDAIGDGMALSIDYAAPEQLQGREVSVATDVFALAAVLRRLLVQAPTHEASTRPAPVALARALSAASSPITRAAVFPAQGTLVRGVLRADLEAILAKALQPEPEARYASVERFADDVRQALRRGRIEARVDERGHRMRRTAYRLRWILASSALLLLGLGVTLWQATEVARQRDVAIREQARLEAVQQAVFHMFRSAGELKGGGATASDVLGNAAQRIQDEFERAPQQGAPVLHALGELYFLITDYAAAKPLLQRLADADPAHVDPALIAAGRYDLAQVLLRQGDATAARPLLAAAQGYWHGEPSRWESRLVDSRLLEAQLLRQEGAVEQAIDLLRAALARRVALSGAHHRETGVFHNNLGVSLFAAGDLAGAREAFIAANEVWAKSGLDDSPDALNTLNNWGAVEMTAGHPEAAEPIFERAVALRRRFYGPSAATAALVSNHGKTLLAIGRAADARIALDEAATMAAQYAGRGSVHHVSALAGAAEAALLAGDLAIAEADAVTALDSALGALGADHPAVAIASLALAGVRASQSRPDEAVRLLQEVDRIATASPGATAQRLARQADVLRVRHALPVGRTTKPAP